MPMNDILIGIGTALWLGILTSISPCPLTTNIAAISYVGRRTGEPKLVLFSGLLYAAGRMTAYILVDAAVVKGILSIPGASNFLQQYMNKLTGPACVVLGVLLLDIIKFDFGSGGAGPNLQKKVDSLGIWGGGLIGFLFALAFCPTSAGLFFGGLIPIAVKSNSVAIVPAVYGFGTAIPVIIFAVAIAFTFNAVGRIFKVLKIIDFWARKTTAVIFLLAGVYLIINHWF